MEIYNTIKPNAENWNISERRAQSMCATGKVGGAIKWGRDWAVPANVDMPANDREITGKYNKLEKKERE